MGEEENPPAHHSPEKKNERALSLVPLPPALQNGAGSAKDRDDALGRVELEKRLALIKVWEENEKTVADNKAHKKLTAIGSWENINKATMDAQLRQIEENIEQKKAVHRAKMKNKVAEIHKVADEKRAVVEAERKEERSSRLRTWLQNSDQAATLPRGFWGGLAANSFVGSLGQGE